MSADAQVAPRQAARWATGVLPLRRSLVCLAEVQNCGHTTLHVVVVDALVGKWRCDGCDRERQGGLHKVLHKLYA